MLLLFHPSSKFYDWKCAVAVVVVVWAQEKHLKNSGRLEDFLRTSKLQFL